MDRLRKKILDLKKSTGFDPSNKKVIETKAWNDAITKVLEIVK